MISLGPVVAPSLHVVINLSRTYLKLQCNGKAYRFSGSRDPSVQTDRYTKGDIMLLLYKDILSSREKTGAHRRLQDDVPEDEKKRRLNLLAKTFR